MQAPQTTRGRHHTTLVILYVIAALGIDMLALYGCRWGIDWRNTFSWRLSNGVDLYKFIAWFVIPFLFTFRNMDWGYWGIKRWHRRDIQVLAALAGAGALAMAIIPFIPSVHEMYPGWARLPASIRWHRAISQLLWTGSWLVGWEFLHRYVLTRAVAARWPRWGWLLVPLSEGLYHLQKALPEMVAMVVFSMLVTPWSMRRRNGLLPLLAHLLIELENMAFLFLT